MTYSKPHRIRIQVFWFLGQRIPTSFSLGAAVGLSKPVLTAKIRLEGGREGGRVINKIHGLCVCADSVTSVWLSS